MLSYKKTEDKVNLYLRAAGASKDMTIKKIVQETNYPKALEYLYRVVIKPKYESELDQK